MSADTWDHPTLSQEEFHRRALDLLAEEAAQPLAWYWLSFADETGFLGAVVIQARGILGATQLAPALGINPGGECRSCRIPAELIHNIPEQYRNRLLSKQEVMDHLRGMKWPEEEEDA